MLASHTANTGDMLKGEFQGLDMWMGVKNASE
jgi:hypothetical protein